VQTTRYLLNALRAEQISHVFLVPGGLIDPFLPALSATEGITPIVAAQEGGAAYMADGFARASGRFGACLAIGGPGVTNMVTALAAARSDGSPVLVVSGEVPTEWEGKGGFQDSSEAALNDLAVLGPLCLSSLTVENIHLLKHHLRASLTRMLAGGQGPVHMSLPLDIQRNEPHAPWEPLGPSLYAPRFLDAASLENFWQLVNGAEGQPAPARLAILAGAGVEKSGATELLKQMAERFQIPVATTLRAKGVFPENHHLSLGVFGYAGHCWAIETLLSSQVEVLIVLGSGLNQRDTMYWNPSMLPSRGLVQVDLDPTAVGRTWHTQVPVMGDCGQFLRQVLSSEPSLTGVLEASRQERQSWVDKIKSAGSRYYDEANLKSEEVPLHPARVIRELRQVMPADTILVVDSGAHRAFCGHYWEANAPRSYLSATNLGPMGWAIPAAVGAKAARPQQPVAVVTGDGCMLMHGLEIQTAARYGLAVIFVVMNNGALGNVWLRASQQGPGPAELTSLPTHDWAGLARSLGLMAETVNQPGQLRPALEKALASNRAYLLDVRCAKEAKTPVNPFNLAKKEWVDGD